MSIVTSGFGRPAYEELARAVAEAKDDDPLRQVMLVVPTETLKVSARRWLAAHGRGGGPGIAGLTMVNLYRLAETLAAASVAGAGRRPITAPVLVGGMRAVVGSQPGLFHDIAEHPQTARALADASRELNHLDRAALPELAAAQRVTAEVISLHSSVRERLRHGYYDEAELMEAATRLVGSLPPVILFLPQELTPPEQRFLASVARVTTVTAIVGVTGAAADSRVLDSVCSALHASSEATVVPPQPVADQVICTTDADDEVRAVLSVAAERLRDGTPGHRIGIVYPSANPYARLLHEHLAAAGIEAYGRGVKPAAERIYGRAVRNLLRLQDRDLRRADVMAWLADAPVKGVNAGRSDRLSRKAGIVSGADWDVRLRALEAGLRLAAGSEEDPERAARQRNDADSAAALREFIAELAADLASLDTAQTWAVLADRFLGLWRRVFPEVPKVPDQARVYEEIISFVDGLRGLDEVAGRPSLMALRETLELELRNSTTRVGKIGSGVMIGPIADAVGQDFDLLCVLGMAEGMLPPTTADDPLLPEAVRLLSGGVLPTWRDRQDRQHRDLLAALAGAGEIVMSFPRADIRSAVNRVPSRWLLPTLQHFLGEDVQATTWQDRVHPAVKVRGSHAQAVLAEDPVTPVGLRQRVALADPSMVDRNARSMVKDRAANAFTRFTGHVGGDPQMPPIGPSPTALQAWYQCPHHYFNRYILGLHELDDPDETIEMSAVDQGSLQHRVLEKLVTQWADPGFGQPWPAQMVGQLDVLIEEAFRDAEQSQAVGLRTPWTRLKRRMRRDLRAWIEQDNDLRAGRWKPLRPELGFADLPVRLPDGTTLVLRGSVDRVDIDADGSLRVLDYKTGSSYKYKRLSQQNPTDAGRFLQLPIYALAAQRECGRGPEPTRADYWFISGAKDKRLIGYEVTDEVLDDALSVIQVAVDGHRLGLFPPRPTAHSDGYDCPSCGVDGGDERLAPDDFDELLSDPALDDYREVIG